MTAPPEQQSRDRIAAFEQWSQGAGRGEWCIDRPDAAFMFGEFRKQSARLATVEAALREAHAVYEDECSEWCAEADPSDPDETPPPWRDKWAKYVAARAALGSEAARPETGWASSELRRAEADKASLPSYVESAAGSEAAQ